MRLRVLTLNLYLCFGVGFDNLPTFPVLGYQLGLTLGNRSHPHVLPSIFGGGYPAEPRHKDGIDPVGKTFLTALVLPKLGIRLFPITGSKGSFARSEKPQSQPVHPVLYSSLILVQLYSFLCVCIVRTCVL